jgi:hypothetical protein
LFVVFKYLTKSVTLLTVLSFLATITCAAVARLMMGFKSSTLYFIPSRLYTSFNTYCARLPVTLSVYPSGGNLYV